MNQHFKPSNIAKQPGSVAEPSFIFNTHPPAFRYGEVSERSQLLLNFFRALCEMLARANRTEKTLKKLPKFYLVFCSSQPVVDLLSYLPSRYVILKCFLK